MRLDKTVLDSKIQNEIAAAKQVQEAYYPEFRIISASNVRHKIYSSTDDNNYYGVILLDVDRDSHNVTVKFHPHIDKLQYVDGNEIRWEYNLEDSQEDRLIGLRSKMFDIMKNSLLE